MKPEYRTKIVIVTWIGSGNYGTALQSFALHKYLEKKGYKVSILTSIPKFAFKHIIKKILVTIGIFKLKGYIGLNYKSIKEKKMHRFAAQKYNHCKLYSKKDIKNLVETTDLFITGSDQIWNTRYKYDPTMFLDFAINKKRIAYASSMGISDFPEEHKEPVRKMLNKFSSIGVREESARIAIANLLGRNDVIQVLDPTFLLNAEEWAELVLSATLEIQMPEKFILCYLIGTNNEYKSQLENVKKKTGIESVVIIPSDENPFFSIEGAIYYKNAGPLEFVDLINRATLICTDSFHATAISINFNRDFVEFLRFKNTDKDSQNSRIYDVLNHYKLIRQLYSDETNQWLNSINYEEVNQILKEDRIKSTSYLIQAIEHQ